jgi:hypothetical protein
MTEIQRTRAGFRLLRNAFDTYHRYGLQLPNADFDWFNRALEQGLQNLDEGLIWILGGFHYPHPHPHLASRPVIELFRYAMKLAILITRKMPIHARMSGVLSNMVSLLSGLQDILSINGPNHRRVVQAAFDRAQAVNHQYHVERFVHPWDYATVSFWFSSCFNPSN